MGKRINDDLVRSDLIAALDAANTRSEYGDPDERGVLRISEFKRQTILKHVPQDLLPDHDELLNAPFWSNLRGTRLPEVFQDQMDQAVENVVRELVGLGVVEVGGTRGALTYSDDDYILTTRAWGTADL